MKYNVLVVDDEPAAVKMIEKIIDTRSDGFKVCGLALNGEEALDFTKNNQVDLVISDVNMPKKDGISLVTELKSIRPEIKSIIVSGYQDFDYLQGAIRAGSCDYVLKPITPAKLLETLCRVKEKLDKDYLLQTNEYYKIALEKSSHYEELNALERDYRFDKEKLFEEITIFMHTHIKEDLSVEKLCKTMGISQATLNRLFKQYACNSYKGYLTEMRMKEAVNIINNVSQIPVKDLAAEVGYNDQFYFSKVFKAVYGVNPSEYGDTP